MLYPPELRGRAGASIADGRPGSGKSGKVEQRIPRLVPLANLEVEVGARGTSRRSHFGDSATLLDELSLVDMKFPGVGVDAAIETRMLDDDHLSVIAEPPAVDHFPALGGPN